MADRRWEDETLSLLEDARRELKKAQMRLATAQRDMDVWQRKANALQIALEMYRTKHGLDATDGPSLTDEEINGYRGKDTRGMVSLWLHAHNSEIVVNDAAYALTKAGLFKDPEQARGTLYPTLRRMEQDGDVTKISRGVYNRRGPAESGAPDDSENVLVSHKLPPDWVKEIENNQFDFSGDEVQPDDIPF